MQRCNIGRRIGRCNDRELGCSTVQNWELNWEVQLCKVKRFHDAELGGELAVKLAGSNVQYREGERGRIGRLNDTESGAHWFKIGRIGCNIGRRIRRLNGPELGGATMQNWQANWGVQRKSDQMTVEN